MQMKLRVVALFVLQLAISNSLSAQESKFKSDPQVLGLVTEILKADASEVPAELLPDKPAKVRREVAMELLRRKQRLADAVLTVLAVRAAGKFEDKWHLKESEVTLLQSLGPKTRNSVAPILADWLISDSRTRRRVAAAALRNLDGLPPTVVRNLLRATNTMDARTRAHACQALSWVEPLPEGVESAIRNCMNEADSGCQHLAASSLLTFNPHDKTAMRIIINTLARANGESLLAREMCAALKKAGPELMQFSELWRTEEGLWDEISVLAERREKEALPMVLKWLRLKGTPEDLRKGIVRALAYMPSVTPEVRDALIEFVTEPGCDGRAFQHALYALSRANGFDAKKLAPIAIEKHGPHKLGEFMETLSACSDERAKQAEALRHYTKHPDTKVSAFAKAQMAKLGCDDPEVLQYIRTQLKSDGPSIRAKGASLTPALAGESGLFLDELFEILEERGTWTNGFGRHYVNDTAVAGLAAHGERALAGLIERLENRDAAIRGLAARALGRMKAHRAVPALTKVLVVSEADLDYWGDFDSPEKVRLEALIALANIGEPHTKDLMPEFEKLLEHEWSRLDAIQAIGNVGSARKRLTRRLVQIWETDPDFITNKELHRAIIRINPGDSSGLVGIQLEMRKAKENLPQSHWVEQHAFSHAMKLTKSLGPEAKPLIPALKRLVEEEELVYFGIRAYAAATLAVIDSENPRWQVMVDRWKTGRWLNDGDRDFHSSESTVWRYLEELER